MFFSNLHKIGYRYFNKKKNLKTDIFVIKAFQRRYLQRSISGKIDPKTLYLSHLIAHARKINLILSFNVCNSLLLDGWTVAILNREKSGLHKDLVPVNDWRR